MSFLILIYLTYGCFLALLKVVLLNSVFVGELPPTSDILSSFDV